MTIKHALAAIILVDVLTVLVVCLATRMAQF
jgi:hypothetical protein